MKRFFGIILLLVLIGGTFVIANSIGPLFPWGTLLGEREERKTPARSEEWGEGEVKKTPSPAPPAILTPEEQRAKRYVEVQKELKEVERQIEILRGRQSALRAEIRALRG